MVKKDLRYKVLSEIEKLASQVKKRHDNRKISVIKMLYNTLLGCNSRGFRTEDQVFTNSDDIIKYQLGMYFDNCAKKLDSAIDSGHEGSYELWKGVKILGKLLGKKYKSTLKIYVTEWKQDED
jgi:hypothetical protein